VEEAKEEIEKEFERDIHVTEEIVKELKEIKMDAAIKEDSVTTEIVQKDSHE